MSVCQGLDWSYLDNALVRASRYEEGQDDAHHPPENWEEEDWEEGGSHVPGLDSENIPS